MGDVRRGYVLLIQGGDPEIRGALMDGVLVGRLSAAAGTSSVSASADTFLEAKQVLQGRGEGCSLSQPLAASSLGEGALMRVLPPEQRRVVEAEIDRQRIAWALRRDMHPVPVDYRGLAFDAEVQYGESLYERGAMQWIAEKLLVGYALVVMGFERLFRSVGL